MLGFSPKFGALIQAIPLAVMGGVSIVVFGLIAIAGAKIWVDNKVDFSDNKNLLVAAITLILGTGDYTLKFGDFGSGRHRHRHLRRDLSVLAAQPRQGLTNVAGEMTCVSGLSSARTAPSPSPAPGNRCSRSAPPCRSGCVRCPPR